MNALSEMTWYRIRIADGAEKAVIDIVDADLAVKATATADVKRADGVTTIEFTPASGD